MATRKQRIEDLLEDMNSFRRNMPFKDTRSQKMPRITPSQWRVIMHIGRGGASVKEVAEALHVRSSAVSQLVDGLVKSGYVKRQEDAKDRRTVILSLTPRTKNQIEAMKKGMVKNFLKVFEVLTDEEFDQFHMLHKKIARAFLIKK